MSEAEQIAADPRVRRLLPPGDEILWIGRPDPRVLFAPADVWLVPLTSIGLVVEVIVSMVYAPEMLFFIVPVMGYVTVGRFVVKHRRKRKTTYVVTRSVALTIMAGTVRRYPLDGGVRRVVFDRGRVHVSVLFRNRRKPSFFYNPTNVPPNVGLDIEPFTYARWDGLVDVLRPAELLAHLDDTRRFRPASEVPPPRAEDAITSDWRK